MHRCQAVLSTAVSPNLYDNPARQTFSSILQTKNWEKLLNLSQVTQVIKKQSQNLNLHLLGSKPECAFAFTSQCLTKSCQKRWIKKHKYDMWDGMGTLGNGQGKPKVWFQGILRLSKTISSNTKNTTSVRFFRRREFLTLIRLSNELVTLTKVKNPCLWQARNGTINIPPAHQQPYCYNQPWVGGELSQERVNLDPETMADFQKKRWAIARGAPASK